MWAAVAMKGQADSAVQARESRQRELASLPGLMAEGDEAALNRLYGLTVDRLYGLARLITGNDADAEEVVCDSYLQAWRQAAQFDAGRGGVFAWLAVIVRSRAQDLRRRRHPQRTIDGEHAHLIDALPDPDRGPEGWHAADQARTVLQRALSELTPVQRQLIALAFYRGLSHQELAERLALPLGTVKSHLRRGLASLKARIAG